MLRLGTQKTEFKAEAKEMQTTELTILNTSVDQKGSERKEAKIEDQPAEPELFKKSADIQDDEPSSNRLEGLSMTSSVMKMMTAQELEQLRV